MACLTIQLCPEKHGTSLMTAVLSLGPFENGARAFCQVSVPLNWSHLKIPGSGQKAQSRANLLCCVCYSGICFHAQANPTMDETQIVIWSRSRVQVP